jgi:hypothetical protein
MIAQTWIAIIELLLLSYDKFPAKLNYNLSQILKLLQLNFYKDYKIQKIVVPEWQL